MTFEEKYDIINISNEREVFKMECIFCISEGECPYFNHGECMLDDNEPCIMDYEWEDDDSYDRDDIYENNWLEDDSYDYDD